MPIRPTEDKGDRGTIIINARGIRTTRSSRRITSFGNQRRSINDFPTPNKSYA